MIHQGQEKVYHLVILYRLLELVNVYSILLNGTIIYEDTLEGHSHRARVQC